MDRGGGTLRQREAEIILAAGDAGDLVACQHHGALRHRHRQDAAGGRGEDIALAALLIDDGERRLGRCELAGRDIMGGGRLVELALARHALGKQLFRPVEIGHRLGEAGRRLADIGLGGIALQRQLVVDDTCDDRSRRDLAALGDGDGLQRAADPGPRRDDGAGADLAEHRLHFRDRDRLDGELRRAGGRGRQRHDEREDGRRDDAATRHGNFPSISGRRSRTAGRPA